MTVTHKITIPIEDLAALTMYASLGAATYNIFSEIRKFNDHGKMVQTHNMMAVNVITE